MDRFLPKKLMLLETITYYKLKLTKNNNIDIVHYVSNESNDNIGSLQLLSVILTAYSYYQGKYWQPPDIISENIDSPLVKLLEM